MDERMRFVSRHLEGESISELCREFGISRVTGHKLVDRYKQHGIEALSDRSRRPYRMANQLPFQVESLIIQIKKEFPNWGAPKIRECMLTRFPDIKTPAKSTVHAVLDRNGLVKHKRANARPKAQGTVLLGAQEPNDQIERHIDIDIQFHRLVLSAAANPALEEMLGQIYQRIHNAMVSRVIPTGPFQALSDHQEILKAIKSRDAAGAYRAATEHVMRIYGKLAARRIEGLKPLATQNEIFNAKSSKA